MRSAFIYYLGLIIIVGIDRITKLWALSACTYTPLVFNQFLSCSVAYNRGVAWSLMHSNDDPLFIAVTALVILITACIAYNGYTHYKIGLNAWGECLIVAGSIGNIYDRFTSGGVIDFIELSYATFSWPLFNVADIAILIGVGIMFFVNYRERA